MSTILLCLICLTIPASSPASTTEADLRRIISTLQQQIIGLKQTADRLNGQNSDLAAKVDLLKRELDAVQASEDPVQKGLLAKKVVVGMAKADVQKVFAMWSGAAASYSKESDQRGDSMYETWRNINGMSPTIYFKNGIVIEVQSP